MQPELDVGISRSNFNLLIAISIAMGRRCEKPCGTPPAFAHCIFEPLGTTTGYETILFREKRGRAKNRLKYSLAMPACPPIAGGPGFAAVGDQFAVLGVGEFDTDDVSCQGLAVRHWLDLSPVLAGIG